MKSVRVRLQRVFKTPDGHLGPVQVGLEYTEGIRIQRTVGLLTDSALVERLNYRIRDPEVVARTMKDLSSDPGTSDHDENWPDSSLAEAHWTGADLQSPMRMLTLRCPKSGEPTDRVMIGLRAPEVVYFKCSGCGGAHPHTIEKWEDEPPNAGSNG